MPPGLPLSQPQRYVQPLLNLVSRLRCVDALAGKGACKLELDAVTQKRQPGRGRTDLARIPPKRPAGSAEQQAAGLCWSPTWVSGGRGAGRGLRRPSVPTTATGALVQMSRPTACWPCPWRSGGPATCPCSSLHPKADDTRRRADRRGAATPAVARPYEQARAPPRVGRPCPTSSTVLRRWPMSSCRSQDRPAASTRLGQPIGLLSGSTRSAVQQRDRRATEPARDRALQGPPAGERGRKRSLRRSSRQTAASWSAAAMTASRRGRSSPVSRSPASGRRTRRCARSRRRPGCGSRPGR